MAANLEITKTDELVTAYLQTQIARLSGAAFKVTFEIAVRWRFSDDPEVRITIPEFEEETGLSRNTVISAIAEARTRKAIVQKSLGNGRTFAPVFQPPTNPDSPIVGLVQISDRSNSALHPKPEARELFDAWSRMTRIRRQPTKDDCRCASEILKTTSIDDCRLALDGWVRYFPSAEFTEIFASRESVERGLIFHDFLQTQE